MSGGSYNYLDFRLSDRGQDDYRIAEDLEKMADVLAWNGEIIAAARLRAKSESLLRLLRQIETLLKDKMLEDVCHAVEWEASADWSWSKVEAVLEKHGIRT